MKNVFLMNPDISILNLSESEYAPITSTPGVKSDPNSKQSFIAERTRAKKPLPPEDREVPEQ